MATIVSQGKTSNPKIEREAFRDRIDVEERIRDIYLAVARKMREQGIALPMWVIDVLGSETK